MNRRFFLGSTLACLATAALPLRAQDSLRNRPLVIGQSAALSGTEQELGRDYFTGAKMAFDLATAAGTRVRHVVLDDGGEPTRAAANAARLIERDGADLLFGFTGAECVEAVSRSAAFARSDIELFAPLSGIEHAAARERSIYLRPTCATEVITLMDRLASLSLTRMALVHTETPALRATIESVNQGLRDRYYTGQLTPLTLAEGGGNAAALVETLKARQIQAVIFLTDPISAGLAIRTLRPRLPVVFMALTSGVDLGTVQQLVNPALTQGLLVSRVVPDPATSTAPVAVQYRAALARFFDEAPTPAGLEGFMAAQTLLALLRRTDNPRHLAGATQRRIGRIDLGGWQADLAAPRAFGRVEVAMLTRNGRLI